MYVHIEFAQVLVTADVILERLSMKVTGCLSRTTITEERSGFKELGVRFIPGKQIKASLIDGARLTAECKVITEVNTGDHVLFIGDVVEATVRTDKDPIVFNGGYRRLGDPLPKPSDEDRAKQKAVMDKHKK